MDDSLDCVKKKGLSNQPEEKVESSESEDFSISNSIKEDLKDLPEVLSFILRLQECILRQRNFIHRLFDKIKEESTTRRLTNDASTQTSEDDVEDSTWNLQLDSGNLVEDIKKAAENVVQQTGFVYEATSGMYYDYNTGYYYNAELGLYYDGQSGIYYYFDESSKSFQFHSQVAPTSSALDTEIEFDGVRIDIHKRKQDEVKEVHKISKRRKPEIKEEGECSESSSESECEIIIEVKNNKDPISSCDSNKNIEIEDCIRKPNIAQNILLEDEAANAWPPCLRIVVKETGLENLLVGSLFIVTCTGGTLGREGDHAVAIPDINISKHHAKVSFSEEEKCYNIVDLGSRNGTYVDGKRLSVALRESEPMALQHGSVVRVGTTHLECHLHMGRETCKDCEPGCALRKPTGNTELTDKDQETKEARHRSELRRLRKRFGLDKLSAKEAGGSLAAGYQDRAEERRKTVGSQNPHAKTEMSSVHESIQSNNKGFKMLSKMGWAKGQALGKDSTKGIIEPVTVEQRPEKAGLGSDLLHLPPPDPKAKKKTELWKKAQKRFQELDD